MTLLTTFWHWQAHLGWSRVLFFVFVILALFCAGACWAACAINTDPKQRPW